MDARVERIEALPGERRYQVGFRYADGSDGSAVLEIDATEIRVAQASLPPGWRGGSPVFADVCDAVRALDRARTAVSAGATLSDVPGGWDVSIGNVVLGPSGTPTCVADGEMSADGDVWTCPGCGAQGLLVGGVGRNVASPG